MWSWLLAVIGVTGIYFEVLWITYALITKQYGFIFSAIAYAAVYIKSFIHWKRYEPEEKSMYNEIYTHGQIDHRYIK
jgi:uncharacterized membrane protein YobD (UPF0266 family)